MVLWSNANNLTIEIRNRIYFFAKESFYSVEIKHSPNLQSQYPHKRQWMAFTQICRLVRTDFLPIYMMETRIMIQPQDSNRYIDTFFPFVKGHDLNTELECCYRNLLIRCDRILDFDKACDILPAMILKAKAPPVHCRIDSSPDSDMVELNSILTQQSTEERM